MSTINDFSGYQPTWCPGCGNWAIGAAVKTALVQLGFDPSSMTAVFGIGCSGNANDFLNCYGFHALHGRAIAAAIGIKIANHKMPVLVLSGDGDSYGEGGNHFLHACRGNHDLTVIIHDNCVYGLTTGQAAPTAKKGYVSKSTPNGIIENPVNPLALALTQGATFVSQAFAGDTPQLIDIIKKAVRHKGFSLVNVLQPCISFNKINTYGYYKEHTYKLDNDYKRDDYRQALEKASELNEEKFPLGVIYEVDRPDFTGELPQLDGEVLTEKKRFTGFDLLIKEFI